MAQVENPKDSKQVIVNLTMTVEEARQVIWQGSGPREPIGKLLNSNQIGYRDLAWAVDKAYNAHVRAAARTLLAHWLGQPATAEVTTRYGPEVIEGSHYLEENEIRSLKWGSMYIGYGLGAGAGLIVIAAQQLSTSKNPLILIIGLLLSLLIFAWWTRRLSKPEMRQYESFRRGRKGEEAIVEVLRSVFDNQWTIFRNLHLPDRKDDIDIALVGPGGVWTVEVKAFGGTVRAKSDTWESLRKGKWVQLRDSPSIQAKRNAAQVRDFLQRGGVNVRWVESVVAMAEPQPIENFVASEELSFWFLPTLESKAANLSTRTPPTEEEIKRITESFKNLATKQIAVEEAKYKK